MDVAASHRIGQPTECFLRSGSRSREGDNFSLASRPCDGNGSGHWIWFRCDLREAGICISHSNAGSDCSFRLFACDRNYLR